MAESRGPSCAGVQCLVKVDRWRGLSEIGSASFIEGRGVLDTERERNLEQERDGGGVEWSEAGTNDGCAQGHTSTAVSPPDFSDVRSA